MPSLLSGEYIWRDNPHCRKFEAQFARLAFSLALASAGSSMAAKIAMMAMTTSSSIRVKAPVRRPGAFMSFMRVMFFKIETSRRADLVELRRRLVGVREHT